MYRNTKPIPLLEHTALFALGGVSYLCLELAWRGRTHWSMFAAGGCCLCMLRRLAGCKLNLAKASALGAAAVSGVELAIGWLCNKVLQLGVWDYSREWGNLAGQICPKYCLLWFFLCGWVIYWLRGLLPGGQPAKRRTGRRKHFKREAYRTI